MFEWRSVSDWIFLVKMISKLCVILIVFLAICQCDKLDFNSYAMPGLFVTLVAWNFSVKIFFLQLKTRLVAQKEDKKISQTK